MIVNNTDKYKVWIHPVVIVVVLAPGGCMKDDERFELVAILDTAQEAQDYANKYWRELGR